MIKSQNLTIKDIAKLSRVSKSTVSRVINGDSHVKAKTREIVEKVIAEYQFSPSKSARAMRGYSNKVIGIIVSRLDSSAENEAIRAMLPLFYQQGYDAIILESQFDCNKVIEHLAMLSQRQVDGLVMFAFSGLDAQLLTPWRNRSVVMARPFVGYTSICYDDHHAVMQLMAHFYQQKQHQRIGYIGVETDDHTTGQLRYDAYLEFCQQYQLTVCAQLGRLDYQTGYQLAPDVLQHKPTAIICATDTIALGLNKYLHEHKLDQIDVGSVGNSKLLQFLFPKTCCVDLGFCDAGILATQALLSALSEPIQAQITIVPSRLASTI
ncbi:LacI family transcriptional regulator [Orbus hercynius]|uniref:LacI family transcriptional regulator n=1 Tax=Orbus hercynius TaxID=593135 RepID=A0A495REB1_9GAMM|nr:trehalose operon repressor TreR [Orbus hercynius]RKS85827.1 LacI family transcriptional regulator [Orbus hercynius]